MTLQGQLAFSGTRGRIELLLGDCPWLGVRLASLCLFSESPSTQGKAQLTHQGQGHRACLHALHSLQLANGAPVGNAQGHAALSTVKQPGFETMGFRVWLLLRGCCLGMGSFLRGAAWCHPFCNSPVSLWSSLPQP